MTEQKLKNILEKALEEEAFQHNRNVELQHQVIQLEGEQKRCKLELCNLLAHLSSSKFFNGDKKDGYIHVNDVHRRIMEARSHLSV